MVSLRAFLFSFIFVRVGLYKYNLAEINTPHLDLQIMLWTGQGFMFRQSFYIMKEHEKHVAMAFCMGRPHGFSRLYHAIKPINYNDRTN